MLNFTPPPLVTILVTALIPTVMGFIWYNPKVFGKAWMQSAGLTMETAMKGFNMPLVFGVSFLLCILMAFMLTGIVIHQAAFFSMLANADGQRDLADHSSPLYGHVKAVYDAAGHNFRTFRHGAFHGALLGIFVVLPIIATSAMFERKNFKYIAINAGYWIVCLTIMGALLCHFMPYGGFFAIKGF